MQVVSKDEIRLDAEHVKILYVMRDMWGRVIRNEVVVTRPMKEWKRG